MSTNEQIKTAVAKIESIVDACFEQSKGSLRWAKSKPAVSVESAWGRPVVAVHIHWELRPQMIKAFAAAGLEAKISNFGEIQWSPATVLAA